MLTILLAMLEDEEDQRKFLKLHTAYEQKLYRIALKILRGLTNWRRTPFSRAGCRSSSILKR